MELATDFPKLWGDPQTSGQDRKRIVRLLVEDVTLIHDGEIFAHLQFQDGATQTLHVPRPLCAWELRQTSSEVLETIGRLLDHLTEGQIAEQLNQRGLALEWAQRYVGAWSVRFDDRTTSPVATIGCVEPGC